MVEMVKEMLKQPMVFFKNGVPTDFVDGTVDPSQFKDYNEAYHRLMVDLSLCIKVFNRFDCCQRRYYQIDLHFGWICS